jgi:hypothetical protein
VFLEGALRPLDMLCRNKSMAISMMGVSIPFPRPVVTASEVGAHRARCISPAAGHALEILGHAIEYLTDEHVHEGGSFSAHDPCVEAIQLLMARNREVYFACPEMPSLGDRLRGWLHLN